MVMLAKGRLGHRLVWALFATVTCTLIAIASSAANERRPSAGKPNIVMIYADDRK